MTGVAIPVLVVLAVITAVSAGRALAASRGDAPLVRLLTLGIFSLSVIFETSFFPRTPAAQLLVAILIGLIVLVVAVGPAKWRYARDPARVKAVFALVGAWAVMFVSDVSNNYALGEVGLLGRLAPGAFWVGVMLLWTLGGLSRETLALSLALTLAGAAASIAVLPRPFAPCNEFKCGLLGGLLKGPFDSENYFAILAVLALVLALSGSLDRARVPVIALATAVLIAASGRSSQVAAVVAIFAMAAVGRLTRGGVVSRGLARTVAFALPAACGSLGLWLVYNSAPSTLSNRGAVWARARDVIDGYEIFGRGISRWEGYGSFVPVSQHFPHNVYLLVLFSGGLVAVVLLLTAVGRAVMASSADPRDFRVVVAYATAVLTLGISEITVNLMSIDGLCWLLLPLFARGSPEATAAPAPSLPRSWTRGSRTLEGRRLP